LKAKRLSMWFYLTLTLVALLSFASCQISVTTPTAEVKGDISFNFDLSEAKAAGYNITKVHIKMTHQDAGIVKEQDLTVNSDNNRAYGTISGLRVGTWDVLAELYENDTEVGSGTSQVTIEAGKTADVHIRINLDTGSANVVVEWGESEEIYYSEDFESGGLGDEWTLGGNVQPQIVDDEATSGTHSLKLGGISDDQTTWAELKINIPNDAYLKFYYKVEIESGYDFFELFVDDTRYTARWSGDVDWQEGKIALSSGEHTIKFQYSRDYTGGYGANAVWIDGITVVSTNLERTYNGHTYKFVPTLTEWHDAKSYCENKGGHLLIVESEEENNFITQNFTLPFSNGRPFIGLSDEETEGVWKWVDGRTLSDTGFSNWSSGEPNDSYGEDYGHYYNNGTWNDIDPDGSYPANNFRYAYGFVCEWDNE